MIVYGSCPPPCGHCGATPRPVQGGFVLDHKQTYHLGALL